MLKVSLRIFLFVPVLLVLLQAQSAMAAPSECQDIWRVDLHPVDRLKANKEHFAKIRFFRWEDNRWQASDLETFFDSQDAEIPLIFFVPGYSSTTSQTTRVGLGIVRNFDEDKPCRVVFWDWFADKRLGNIRRDVRSKLPIVTNTAEYLALFLQDVKPQSKVCLFGFSFGSRIVCNAVESFRKSEQHPEGLRLRLVLSGAATDRDWFARGQRHSKIPEIVEKILITYSPDDWALRFYPLMYNFPFRERALGLEGLPLRSVEPAYRDRFENINVSRYIGDEHKTLRHVQTPAFRNRIDEYFFFE